MCVCVLCLLSSRSQVASKARHATPVGAGFFKKASQALASGSRFHSRGVCGLCRSLRLKEVQGRRGRWRIHRHHADIPVLCPARIHRVVQQHMWAEHRWCLFRAWREMRPQASDWMKIGPASMAKRGEARYPTPGAPRPPHLFMCFSFMCVVCLCLVNFKIIVPWFAFCSRCLRRNRNNSQDCDNKHVWQASKQHTNAKKINQYEQNKTMITMHAWRRTQ